jgi:hypothetical protein
LYTLTDSSSAPLEFLADSSQSGTVSWNLLGASFLNTTIGMEFQLNSFDFLADSFVTISNAAVNPIPEPATVLLTGLGTLGIGAFRFFRRAHEKRRDS